MFGWTQINCSAFFCWIQKPRGLAHPFAPSKLLRYIYLTLIRIIIDIMIIIIFVTKLIPIKLNPIQSPWNPHWITIQSHKLAMFWELLHHLQPLNSLCFTPPRLVHICWGYRSRACAAFSVLKPQVLISRFLVSSLLCTWYPLVV